MRYDEYNTSQEIGIVIMCVTDCVVSSQLENSDSRSSSSLSLKQMQVPHRQNSEHNANMNQAAQVSKVQRSVSAHNQKVTPHMYGASTENSAGEWDDLMLGMVGVILGLL